MSRFTVKSLFILEYKKMLIGMDSHSINSEFAYFCENLFEAGSITEKVFNACMRMRIA